MAFEIKDVRKKEGDLMKIPFDRKKDHFKSLEMVQALLSSDKVWSKWKTDRREEEKKETEGWRGSRPLGCRGILM
jgi:hypothetical protein